MKHFHGSILLETLISILILGLIVIGSFYSYSFVYQRVLFQRRQRFALGVLQGFMELTISELISERQNGDLRLIDLENKETELKERFGENIPSMIDLKTNTDPDTAFIELEDISLDRSIDGMVGITIKAKLYAVDRKIKPIGNGTSLSWLPITLITRIKSKEEET